MNPKLFLGGVFALFVGILIFAWWEASRANPVLLDSRGRPVSSHSSQ
ncbi:MAG: hypothetical protein ACKV22_06410 [Bryobacteraceae bacterium]